MNKNCSNITISNIYIKGLDIGAFPPYLFNEEGLYHKSNASVLWLKP